MLADLQKWFKKESVFRTPKIIMGSTLGIALLLVLRYVSMEEWVAVLLISLFSIHVVLYLFSAGFLLGVSIFLMVLMQRNPEVNPEVKNPETITGTHWINAGIMGIYAVMMFMGQFYWQGILMLISLIVAQFGYYLARKTMHEIMRNKLKRAFQ